MPEQAGLVGSDRLHGTPGTFEVRVCRSCGSGRTFPLVDASELARLYPPEYDAYTLPRCALSRALATALYRWRYRRSLARGPLRPLRGSRPGRLLDVGAGRGDLGVVLGRLGWEVTGLEPSEAACEEGRSRGVSMVQGTLSMPEHELGGPFDAIVFEHSLEHVAEPREDIDRARQLLREGGMLIVAVPNFGSWQRRAFGSAWFHLDLPRHRSHFTPTGLARLLENGFEAVDLRTSTTPDGLLNSVQFRLFGRRALTGAPFTALAFASLPLSLVLDRARGGGDELSAAAVRPRGR